ncbi:hypothetical protein MMC26_006764 [Xylographa opegraphella]|nr:hypothetical protein [Xylographa opegraphella]
MPHPIQSHKSEEGLMRRFFSVDTAKVAARTSSVRLQRRRRPADGKSKINARSECHHISNSRASDVIDVKAVTPVPRRPRCPKISKPPASVLSAPEQVIAEPVAHTRLSRLYDGREKSECGAGTDCKQEGARTTAAAQTHGSIKVERQDVACAVGKDSSNESASSKSVVRDTVLDSSTVARTRPDQQIGVQMKSAEQLQQDEWRLVRAALQVELDPGQDVYGDGATLHERHGRQRAWKHAERNFFPPGSQHLDPEDVVRSVLERHVKLKVGRVRPAG